MNKICKVCGIEKSQKEFQFHNKIKGTLRAECKICTAIRVKQERINNIDKRKLDAKRYYLNNKKARIIRAGIYQKNNPEKRKIYGKTFKEKIKQEWFDFKSQLVCTNCGENHIACLEFHHVDPSIKEESISRLVYTRKRLQEELEKCIVLCSNCHRKLHYNEKLNDE